MRFSIVLALCILGLFLSPSSGDCVVPVHHPPEVQESSGGWVCKCSIPLFGPSWGEVSCPESKTFWPSHYHCSGPSSDSIDCEPAGQMTGTKVFYKCNFHFVQVTIVSQWGSITLPICKYATCDPDPGMPSVPVKADNYVPGPCPVYWTTRGGGEQ